MTVTPPPGKAGSGERCLGGTGRDETWGKQGEARRGELDIHGNNIGRGSGTSSLALTLLNARQGRVVGGEDDADTQGAEDEEDSKSPVHSPESSLDICPGSLGLGSHHGNILGADDGEGG